MLKALDSVSVVLHPYGCKAVHHVSGTVGREDTYVIPRWLADYIKVLQLEVIYGDSRANVAS